MRNALLLCAVLTLVALLQNAAAQTIWKWVDKNGVTHYSDQPGPNAVKVNVQVQTFEPETATGAPSQPTRAAAEESYQSIDIIAPANDATLFSAEGPVSVQLQLDPGLQSGHSVQILFDGQSINDGSTSLSYSLPDVERGTHTLQARVIGPNGATLISSPTITFHLRAPTVNRAP